MHHESINKEVTEATHQGGYPVIMIPLQQHMALCDMHKKGFIDIVKGLLAWFNKVFEVFKYLWSNSEHFVYFVNYRRKQP